MQCALTRENRSRIARAAPERAISSYTISSRCCGFLSAGESHGQALVITLDGVPAGLDLDVDALNAQLSPASGRLRARTADGH